MNKGGKIVGIVVLSILIFVNLIKLFVTAITYMIASPGASFESGYIVGSSIGSVLFIALLIFGIVKIAKSLSNKY
ncbi:hypothetical protein SH1V18_03990 [Vallitalea longa]|uniref:Uncharacterized protein n=1 Tax=Vallitalea longa TaxID=2936439 RepID=A0A9W6DET5_9FIRM|nr:hypothetical protein [Vallitalea longa]GKX27919.1 hypothetical protein SH1V18_03990 [Vallitalea longa]